MTSDVQYLFRSRCNVNLLQTQLKFGMNLFPFQFQFRMKHSLAVQQPKLKRVPTNGLAAGWTTPLLKMRE